MLVASQVAAGLVGLVAVRPDGWPWCTGAAALLGWLLWKHRGSVLSTFALTALLALAAVMLALGLNGHPVALLLLPLVLSQLPAYERWPLVLGVGMLFAALPLAAPFTPDLRDSLALSAIIALQTAYLVHATRQRAIHARALFDVEFQVLAMGREGRIRLDLDVLRAETATGQRLKDVHDRVARTLQEVQQAADASGSAAESLRDNGRVLTDRSQCASRDLGDVAMSLEQVAVIVKDSAEAAMAARKTAQAATALAVEGAGIVSQMVGQMQAIDGASKRITDIIGVIDGIAFQTNLLALNAAVEAARAGDAGRGFAVVASEVRSLAQRVSRAAAEVKGLIEASVAASTQGSALAASAGETMTRLTQAVNQVDTTFHDLSADTHEHAQGLVAMRDTMYGLRDATQQNLKLAEQAQQIAEAMTDHARLLGDALAAFRLPAGKLPAPPAPSARPPAGRAPPAPAAAPPVAASTSPVAPAQAAEGQAVEYF